MKRTGAARDHKPSAKDSQALLHDAGLRVTAPRLAVLAHLYARGGPRSHAEVVASMRAQGFDRATLYRVLMDLADANLLTRTDLGDHVWRFELAPAAGGTHAAERHPHFVCTDCGEIACLPGVTVEIRGGARAPRSVKKEKVAIQLRGRCDACER